MVYFIILPAFLIVLIAQAAFLAVTSAWPALRFLRPFAWRVLVGSTVGFLAATLTVFAQFFAILLVAKMAGFDPDEFPGRLIAYLVVFTMTLEPILASAIGMGAGSWIGIVLAMRADRRRASSTTT